MTMQEQIRKLDAAGVSARQIAKDLGISRDSVAKYIAVQDFSPKPPVIHRRPGASVLTGFTSVIDEWLAEDEGRPASSATLPSGSVTGWSPNTGMGGRIRRCSAM
ncbi:hypothetical protein MFAL_33520 [Mycolicibacterium fallax]|nr:hypothetical protein MFAL_18030 [Mycolicibacterium fallax]BBY99885.1 hypothetical protein MFAL_33520 [Mycolicibacterium fallax]